MHGCTAVILVLGFSDVFTVVTSNDLGKQSPYLNSDKSNSLDQEIVLPVAFSLVNVNVPVLETR